MADDIQLNSGSGGDICAADDVGGKKYQRIKAVPGGDGNANNSGCTSYSYLSAASGNQDANVVKASAGVLYGIEITNSNTTARYIKIYNLATSPTSASTVYRRLMIPAGGGVAKAYPYGVEFSAGIAFRLTTGAANNNAVAVAADEILLNLEYV